MARRSSHFSIHKLSYKTLFIIVSFLLIIITILWKINSNPENKVSAAWWNDSWRYRKAISISNTSGSSLTNQRVKITLDTATLAEAGKIQTDCDDLRVTDLSGSVLDHWDINCNSASTNVYVKTSSIPVAGTIVYVYYGNPAAVNTEKRLGTIENPGTSCQMMKDQGSVLENGTYYVVPGGNDSEKTFVYCDQVNDNGGWTLLMNQNVTQGGYFTDSTQALNYNESDPTAARYSILNKISKFKDNGFFTLKINWPGYSIKNIWSQTSDPTQDVDISGYTPINIGATSNYWGGLEYGNGSHGPTNSNGSFIDGSVNHSNWFYAVASYSAWSGGIPSTSTVSSSGVNQTQLWIRGTDTMNNVSSTSLTEETGGSPIGYWKMDEGYGTVFYDSSSNQNNGSFYTGTTTPTWQDESQCLSGKCLKFTSTASTSISNFNYNILKQGQESASWTLSVWVKPSNQKITDRVILGRSGCIGGLYGNRNYFHFAIRTSNCLTNAKDITFTIPKFQEWYYLTAVYNNRNMSFYVNGKLVGTDTFTDTMAAYDDILYIGGINGTSNYEGSIDEAKVYPYARTINQIKADYNAGKSHISTSQGTSTNMGNSKNISEALNNGLVAYWKMDENSGTSIIDSSGSSYTANFGTGTSSPSWSAGKFGIGTSFNGSTNYISIGSTDTLNFTSSFTLSAWVKTSQTVSSGNYPAIAGKGFLQSGTNGYGLFINGDDSNKVTFQARNNNTISTALGISISDNKWHHVVGVRNHETNTSYIYVDGQLINSNTTALSAGYSSSRNFGIGMRNGSNWSFPFNGMIDEVRVYDRALNNNEIQNLYNWAPGPLNYWDFNDGIGSTITDKSGSNLNGSLGSGGAAPTWVSGKYGSGIKLDGNNDYASVSSASLGLINNNFTFSSWVKLNNMPADNPRIFSYAIDANNGYSLVAYGGGSANNFVFEVKKSGVNYGKGYGITPKYTSDTWYYLTGTFDSATNTSNLYINGILVAGSSGALTIPPATNILYFGSRGDTGYLNGLIDDVKIYNYIRTPKQIVEDMNAGHPAGGSPVGSQTVYYKFDEGYGTNTADWSPQKRTATLTCSGTTCSIPAWKNDGKFGKSLYFFASGTDRSYITTSPINTGSSIGDKITLTMWIKPDITQTGNAWLVRNGTGADENYGMFLGSASGGFHKVNMELYDSTFRTVSSTGYHVPNNTWSQLTVIFSQGQWFRIYVNGVFKEQVTIPYGVTVASTSSFNIGGHSGTTGQYFNGYIDEFKIYNNELTDDEIKIDYNRNSAMQMGSLSTGSSNPAPATSASQEYCVPGDSNNCSPPIAEWKMDEGVGTSIIDNSSNDHTGSFGTGSSSPTWSQGKIGSGLYFNGVSTEIDIPDLSFSGNFTYSFWINSADSSGAKMWSSGSTSQKFGLLDGKFFVRVISSSDNTLTLPNLNTWHHVVLVRDSNNKIDLYVDGKSNRLFSDVAQSGTTYLNIIGRSNDGSGQHFKGKIDQIRIYNYARTPAQIAWDYNRGAPIGHWKFDECQGSSAYDWSGIGNTGAIIIGSSGTQNSLGTCQVGTSAAWTNGVSGKYNSSLNFDGTDDYINFGNQSNFNLGTNSFSYCYWLKTTASSGHLFGKATWACDDWGSWLVSGGKARFEIKVENPPCSGYSVDSAVINDGQWHHLCGTYDRNGYLNVYTDGKVTSTVNISSLSTYDISNGSNLLINGGAPGFSNSQIDDVRLYNYNLTSEQIKTIFNNGSVNFGP